MITKDVDIKKGWINLHCQGGCLEVYKAMYGCCFKEMVQMPKHMEIAIDKCEDKEVCRFDNSTGTHIKFIISNAS